MAENQITAAELIQYHRSKHESYMVLYRENYKSNNFPAAIMWLKEAVRIMEEVSPPGIS